MNDKSQRQEACAVCGKTFPVRTLIPGAAVRETVSNEIRRELPQWSPSSFICRADLNTFRSRYVHSLLESERGELTSLEKEVVNSLRDHEFLAKDLEDSFEKQCTLGERMADRLASFGGSWKFLISFAVFMLVWVLVNTVLLAVRSPFDPYPFILLNLLLSCLAAIQAPVILMSQNRQEAKDRIRSRHDYQVNLKAELEIRHLHEKVDHLLSHQWERLAQIQEIQLELLEELGKKG